MCNSTKLFFVLGEIAEGKHDDEVIDLPNGCCLKLLEDTYSHKWVYEIVFGAGGKMIGMCDSRNDAFEKALDELAYHIN
ncbi:MAG: hypothetical protein HC836_37155 [Richelia sp. RM2_1_2]|nr:hypothetical protein [Richelia sp. RM2_1_2]